MEEKNNNNNTPKRYPTQLVLTIRVIVGAYVLYSVYEVMTSGEDKSLWMYLAVAFIAIAGTIILGWALKMLICGQYEGGKADEWSKMKAEEEQLNEQLNQESTDDETIEEASFEELEK